jgi:dolichol kinase
MSSIVIFSLAGIAILVVTILIEFSIRKDWLEYFLGRKLLHVLAIGITAWMIDRDLDSYMLGLTLVAIGVFLMYILFKFKWWLQQESSYGIALFPISLGGLLLLGVSAQMVSTAAWVLAVSDASAGWVGRKWGSPKYIFLSETKSYQGAIAFFVTALICMGIRLPDLHMGWWILFAFIPTITELFSWKGSDNFFLPIFTVGWIQLLHCAIPQSF